MNHVVLIGRLTRDPELRYTPNGIAVANFDIAVDRPANSQGQKETDFIRIVVWQKAAENAANFLKKGRLVAVEGRLQIRSYENTSGQKQKAAEVIASYVQYLERETGEKAKQEQSTKEKQDQPALSGIDLDALPF